LASSACFSEIISFSFFGKGNGKNQFPVPDCDFFFRANARKLSNQFLEMTSIPTTASVISGSSVNEGISVISFCCLMIRLIFRDRFSYPLIFRLFRVSRPQRNYREKKSASVRGVVNHIIAGALMLFLRNI
jgi:hypothetical protein